ncbi:hypothetical protein [Acinetobacter bereziniae]|uniref:hypothetical protein n=1 Tax=Acinetobacter bereziniae TaxID=106648 RepID=UPI003570E1AF
MTLINQFISFVVILCLAIIYAHAKDYSIIDPSKEISTTENALGLRSFEERTIIDYTFYPHKQTGQNQVFNSDEMKQIELESFELKNIVKTLYPFEIVQMNDSQFSHSNTKLFTAVEYKYYEKCNCVEGKKLIEKNIVVFPHKVIKFKNIKKEKRFLLPVEIFEMNGTGREIRITDPKLELYLFKQLKTGKYQLVTRTPINYEGIDSYEGFEISLSKLSVPEIASNIRLIGADRKGSFFRLYAITNNGAQYSDWYVLSLKEDEFLRSYLVSNASEDTTEMFYRPKAHKFDSKLSFIPVKGQSYYPIKIQYKGNKFIFSNYKLEDKNQINRVEFDPNLGIYSYDSPTMQRMLLEQRKIMKGIQ